MIPPARDETNRRGERLRLRDLESSSAATSPRTCSTSRQVKPGRDPRQFSERQTVLAAVMDDKAFVAGAADGEIGGAFGALSGLNDALAELGEWGWRTSIGKSAGDIGGLSLAACRRWDRRGAGGRKPKRGRIQGERSGRQGSGITKLKAEFDGGDFGGRARQQSGRNRRRHGERKSRGRRCRVRNVRRICGCDGRR